MMKTGIKCHPASAVTAALRDVLPVWRLEHKCLIKKWWWIWAKAAPSSPEVLVSAIAGVQDLPGQHCLCVCVYFLSSIRMVRSACMSMKSQMCGGQQTHNPFEGLFLGGWAVHEPLVSQSVWLPWKLVDRSTAFTEFESWVRLASLSLPQLLGRSTMNPLRKWHWNMQPFKSWGCCAQWEFVWASKNS